VSDAHHPPASDGVLAELLRDGDDYGLTRFYAAHAGSAHAYARKLCGPTAADDAMAGALATAVARVRAGDGSSLADLVADAIRQEALTRVRDDEEQSSPRWRRRGRPECQRTPALLAARAAGRLSSEDEERLQRHLDSCASCRELARRAREAEQAFAEVSPAPIGAAQDAALVAMAAEAGGDVPQPVAPPPIAIEPIAVEPEPEPVAVEPEPIAVEPEAVAVEPEPVAAEPEAVEPEPVDAEQVAPVEPVDAVPARVRRGGAVGRLGAALRRLNAPPPAPQPVAETAATEPVAAEPELVEVQPEPVAVEAEPAAIEPEPVAVEPVAVEPEPVAVEPEPVAAEPEPVETQSDEPEREPRRIAFVRMRRAGRAEEEAPPEVVAPEPVPEPVAAEPEPEPEPVAAEPEQVAAEPEPEPAVVEPVVPVAAAVPTPEPEPDVAPAPEEASAPEEPAAEPAQPRWTPRPSRRRQRRETPAPSRWGPSGPMPRRSAAPEPGSPDRWARGTRTPIAAEPDAAKEGEWAKGAARGTAAGLALEPGGRAPLRTRRHSSSGRAAAFIAFLLAAGAVAAYASGAFDTSSDSNEVASPSTLTTPTATTTTPAAKPRTSKKPKASKPAATQTTPQTVAAAPVVQAPVTPTRTVAQRPTSTTPTRTTPRRQTSSGTTGTQDPGSTRATPPSDDQRRQPPPG
jgi:hypothetical protein